MDCCSYLFKSKPWICRPRGIFRSCSEGHMYLLNVERCKDLSSPGGTWTSGSRRLWASRSSPSNPADLPKAGEEGQVKMDAQPQEGTAHGTPNGCKANATKRHSKKQRIFLSPRAGPRGHMFYWQAFHPKWVLGLWQTTWYLEQVRSRELPGRFPKTLIRGLQGP